MNKCFATKTLSVLMALICSSGVIAQSRDGGQTKSIERQLIANGFVGTSSVEFFEVSRAGKVEGCSLVYKAVFPDVVYRSGALQVAVGNITFNVIGKKTVGLSLKVGTRPLLDANAPFEPPNFAYLVTSNGSTARVEQTSANLDDGFKLFVYSFVDPSFPKIFQGLLQDEVVKIAFNRTDNGVDQQFDVDLRVESSHLVDGKIERIRSEKSIVQFIECLDPLMNSIAE